MVTIVAVPAGIAFASAWACWKMLEHNEMLPPDLLRGIAQVYASVAVTMVGFSLAMLAILVSASSTRLLRNMMKTGHYDLVNGRLFVTASFFGIALVAALASLFLPDGALAAGLSIATGALVGACVALAISSYRFWTVLKLLSADRSGPLE